MFVVLERKSFCHIFRVLLLLWCCRGINSSEMVMLYVRTESLGVFFRSAPAAGAPATEGGAPNAPPNLTSNRRLQQTQAQVDEVSTPLTALLICRREIF